VSHSLSRRLLFSSATAAAVVASVPVAIAADHPDAALIRICDAHGALMDLVNSGVDGDDDDGPTWQAYDRSRDAITAFRPETIEGMLAKARAAKAEARRADGSEMEDGGGTPAEGWAWDLVNDLLRIGGRGV
jgi:hypothetical protein